MTSLRVLVIDDSESDLELLVRELTRGGYVLSDSSMPCRKRRGHA